MMEPIAEAPSAKRQKIAEVAPSQLTEDPSDRAAKCKCGDVMRIPLKKLAVWPKNRGGTMIVPLHVHEIAADMQRLGCKKSRYGQVSVVQIPKELLYIPLPVVLVDH
jgi:hypothetical protein